MILVRPCVVRCAPSLIKYTAFSNKTKSAHFWESKEWALKKGITTFNKSSTELT